MSEIFNNGILIFYFTENNIILKHVNILIVKCYLFQQIFVKRL